MIIKTDPFTNGLPPNEIIYPSSDGKRMAENMKQYRYITMIKGGLGSLFYDKPEVLVVADLLWYPVEGKPQIAAEREKEEALAQLANLQELMKNAGISF